MTPDERFEKIDETLDRITQRLDRLTERHEALSESVESLRLSVESLVESQKKTDLQINRLGRLVLLHEARIMHLEGFNDEQKHPSS